VRLLVVTQYFPPEVGAPQTRLFELARWLVGRGHRVTVLAPWPHYPTGVVPAEYRGRALVREWRDGVRVYRTAVYATANRGFARRIAGQLSFTAAASLVGPLLGATDAVLVESPPLFHGVAGALVGRLRRAPFVFNVADLWLESAVEMGVVDSPALIGATRAFQDALYREATLVTTVTEGFAEQLRQQGVPAEKVRVLPNGVDVGFFRPVAEGRAVRAELGLDGDRFMVLYAGTHGLAQGLGVVLDAAERLRDRSDVRFVLVGEGADKADLVERAERLGLPNVRFLPNQPKARMPALLSAADACVVPLRDLPMFRVTRPSKMFEAMAVGRPVVLAVAGDAADVLARAGAGIAVPPEEPEALARAVTELADDRARASALGEAGRAWVGANLARETLAGRFEAILLEAIERHRAGRLAST
jgi:glycosyltransferase involved in cell wall biosynthesis